MNAKRFFAFAIAVFSLIGVLGFSPAASARVSIGIGLGFPALFAPPPLRREVVYARPGTDYTWVGGYWDWRPALRNYVWIGGRWVLPSYRDSYWVGPRFGRGYYYSGYWGRGFDRGFRGHDRFAFRGRDGFRDHDRFRDRDGFRGHESFRGHDGRRDRDGRRDHRR
jgi:hypothetical protein